VAIRNQKDISIANLGDSGFVLIRFRNGEAYTFARSKEQQHSFNIPFQLSILPGQKDIEQLELKGKVEEVKCLKKVLKNKNNLCQDVPDMADEYTIELQDGDIIISATDGVFDNLFTHEILKIVKDFKAKNPRLCTKEQALVRLMSLTEL
jgi:serine/threonine protein phosphatase PrpC